MYWSDTLAYAMSYMASPWIIPLDSHTSRILPFEHLSPEGIVQTVSDSVDYLPFAIGSADILLPWIFSPLIEQKTKHRCQVFFFSF